MIRRNLPLLPLVLAAACGSKDAGSPLSYPGIDGHARYFPLRSGTGVSCHDPSVASPAAPCIAITCSSCHTDSSSTSTFKQVSCNTGACHAKPATDQTHTGVTNYTWATGPSPNGQPPLGCLDCHANGAVPHPFFPRGPGTLHPYLCVQCHLDHDTVPRPADWATNLARMACVSCHCPGSPGSECTAVQPAPLTRSVGTVHAQIISQPDLATAASGWGFPATSGPSQWCLRCHNPAPTGVALFQSEIRPPSRTTHGAQPGPRGQMVGPLIPSASDKHGPPNNVQLCLSCHQADPPLFATTPPAPPFNSTQWAQDWTPTGVSCAAASCHPGQPQGP